MVEDQVNARAHRNETNNLVIYEWAEQKNPSQWLDLMVEFLDIIETPPDLMHVTIADKQKRMSPKNFRKKLHELAASALTSIDAEWLEDKKNLSRSKMIVAFDFANRGRCVQIYSLQFLESARLTDLLQRVLDFLTIEYGIAYEMPRNLGPFAYASGIGYGSYDNDLNRLPSRSSGEARNVGDFGRVYGSRDRHEILTRKFRDIYRLNFICDGHLENTISGLPLAEFISRNDYGTVKKIKDNSHVWSVPDATLPACRKAMIEAGLTISKHWD